MCITTIYGTFIHMKHLYEGLSPKRGTMLTYREDLSNKNSCDMKLYAISVIPFLSHVNIISVPINMN